MRINHNISSMVTQGALGKVSKGLNKSLERLSTGLRINRASDDAAGLSVSEQMRTQVKGIGMAKRNANDGIALLQIAEGAANEISSVLQRMRELSVQSSNDTVTGTERGYIQQEFTALQNEIDRITEVTQYNGQTLIDGGAASFGAVGSGSSVLHIGPNANTADEITILIDDIDTAALSVDTASSNVLTHTDSTAALASIDIAIDSVNNMRSDLGAYVNRIEHAVNNLDNQEHNMQAAESLIRDVDFASESSEFTKNQILMQSATSMLSQANMVPQGVLSLLG